MQFNICTNLDNGVIGTAIPFLIWDEPVLLCFRHNCRSNHFQEDVHVGAWYIVTDSSVMDAVDFVAPGFQEAAEHFVVLLKPDAIVQVGANVKRAAHQTSSPYS